MTSIDASSVWSYVSGIAGAIRKINPEQNTIETYLVEHGKFFEVGALTPLGLEFADSLDLDKFQIGQCFVNAQRLTTDYPSKYDIQYAEGFACTPTAMIPLLHAWVVVDGVVFDPTWHNLMVEHGKGPGRVDRYEAGTEYFGVTFTHIQIYTAQMAHTQYISLLDDYQCGWPLIFGDGKHKERKHAD